MASRRIVYVWTDGQPVVEDGALLQRAREWCADRDEEVAKVIVAVDPHGEPPASLRAAAREIAQSPELELLLAIPPSSLVDMKKPEVLRLPATHHPVVLSVSDALAAAAWAHVRDLEARQPRPPLDRWAPLVVAVVLALLAAAWLWEELSD